MASPGKAPIFNGTDYSFWKVRMKAYLQSLGSDIWEITQDAGYEVLEARISAAQVAQHEANCKAVNALFACLERTEFDRVESLETGYAIWKKLETAHEGTSQVKARLRETYRRE